jgi:hypothetical protein
LLIVGYGALAFTMFNFEKLEAISQVREAQWQAGRPSFVNGLPSRLLANPFGVARRRLMISDW